MDIVYVFKQSEDNDSEELRYSLRSLRNLKHDKVYIVGEKPAWLQNADHVNVEQNMVREGDIPTKYKNVSKNLQAAAATEEISDNFVFMNDDFFVMKPFDSMPAFHWGPMRDVIALYAARYDEESNYIMRMKELYTFLRSQGHEEPLSYELHVPIVFNKAHVARMYAKDFSRIYQIRTMYGNYFQVGGQRMDDVKVYLDPRHNDPGYNADPGAYLAARSFLSASGGSFRSGKVGEFVRAAFPDKSPYEI
jgi:hypothetical protein